jgi:hypothetical protein
MFIINMILKIVKIKVFVYVIVVNCNYYCSNECQREDWIRHIIQCQYFQNFTVNNKYLLDSFFINKIILFNVNPIFLIYIYYLI